MTRTFARDPRATGLRLAFLRSAFVPLLLVFACADDAGSDGPESTTSPASGDGSDEGIAGVEVSGDAFAFALPGQPYGRIDGAMISVLERPDQVVTSDAEGHFSFELVPSASMATFALVADGFPPAYTKTFTLPDGGTLDRVTFQVPDDDLFDALAALLMLEPDPEACQIVSTVTRVGKSIYDAGAHGEAGATVTLDPPVPQEHGPIYFNESVIPDPTLVETSEDGGVLFTNVPVGTYTMRAHKDGVTFEDTTMVCAAGVLVNASPPYGLQALP